MDHLQRIEGTHTALVTPFKEIKSGLTIDYAALEHLVDAQVRARVGIVLLGTTGESPTIRDGERIDMTHRVVTQVDGAVPVTIGTGTNDTTHSITLTRMADEQGASAVLTVNPYYNRPPQRGMQQHFETIADATDTPVILYDVPGRTSIGLETDTIRRLADHDNIIGMKWASGNLEQVSALIAERRENFSLVSGDDHRTVEMMSEGGEGVISVVSNLFPEQTREMVEYMRSGNTSQARILEEQLLPYMEGCFVETNPIPVKTALALRGDIEELFRLPLVPMRQDLRAQWEQVLQAHPSFFPIES